MDFENDIRIDETALDVECLDQPTLMLQYGRLVAEKEKTLSKAKTHLDITRAELSNDVRNNPEDYDLAKVTESAIMSAIMADETYQAAEKSVTDAQYELKVARAAVEAIQQKKDMLEALIRLHGQQYFAGPKVPRDLHEEWIGKQQAQRSNTAVANGMKRKRKGE